MGLALAVLEEFYFREKRRGKEKEKERAQASKQAETKMATFQHLNVKILSVMLLSGLS